MICSVEYAFFRHEHHGCFRGNDLHRTLSIKHSDYWLAIPTVEDSPLGSPLGSTTVISRDQAARMI